MTVLVWILLISILGFAGIVNAEQGKQMKRVKIRGVVERIDGREAVVRTSRGAHVRVMMGPESYWAYRGYHLEPGQNVSVYGWYPEDNHDSFFAGTISGSGFSFGLTSSSGTPYWVEQDEQHRMAPSYTVYHEWYGPQYIYNPPPRREEVRIAPPGHDDRDRHGHREH